MNVVHILAMGCNRPTVLQKQRYVEPSTIDPRNGDIPCKDDFQGCSRFSVRQLITDIINSRSFSWVVVASESL